MTYVVTDNCIACKYTDCVEVCPVDCFYEGENMLVIHPDECIDCGVCEPECPADAIRPDTEPDMEKWVEFNRKYSEAWPVIITKKDPLPEADDRDGEAGKMDKYFSEAARRGRLTAPDSRPRAAIRRRRHAASNRPKPLTKCRIAPLVPATLEMQRFFCYICDHTS